MQSWVLLLYKVPPEPSARRVYVWRKLKRLGALLLHDAVWVLPATSYTAEQLQWLAVEIRELEGSALVWEAHLAGTAAPGQGEASDETTDETLVRQFLAQVEDIYRDLLAELERPDADIVSLSRRYQQAKAQDYFHSEVGKQVREALTQVRETRGDQREARRVRSESSPRDGGGQEARHKQPERKGGQRR